MRLPDIPVGTEAKVNGQVDDFVASLAVPQATYFGKAGRYWQGIKLENSKLGDGSLATRGVTKTPTDQKENWTDFGVVVAPTSDIATSVHVYKGPQGSGYVAIAEVSVNGSNYSKTVNVGAENYRDTNGWILVS